MNADAQSQPQPNAVSDSRFESSAIAETKMRATRPLFWSVRRELWENRSIYIVPLVAAGLALVATFLAWFRGTNLAPTSPEVQGQLQGIAVQLSFTGLLLMGVTFIVAIFYCLDAIYGERRDRSIFFWKSLPVSDTVTVLAKASIPLLVIPLVTFAIAAVTQWIELVIDAAMFASIGRNVAVIRQIPAFQMQVGLLYHLIAVHSLWYAPFFGYLLLVSAWARRAPILWAAVPPLAIGILEKLAFNTSHFINFLKYRFAGGMPGAGLDAMGMPHRPVSGATPVHFLASPELWGGLILTALFLAAAIQLRRYRAPS